MRCLRRADLDRRNRRSRVDRTLERDCELVRRAGQVVEFDLGREPPERRRHQFARPRLDDRADEPVLDPDRHRPFLPHVRDRSGSVRGRERFRETAEVARAENGVRCAHDRRQPRAGFEGALHGVRGAVRLRLAGKPDVQPCEQPFDLLGEVAGHDGHRPDALGRQLTEERRDHRAAVDGQDRLRPALGDGPQAPAFPGGHHDRFH